MFAASFYVRNIPITGDLVQAPMDGYSDLPFRAVCRSLGSAMSYTEFINALDIVQSHPFVHQKLRYLPEERPVVFQIFDNDPDRLVEVALRLQALNPDIIDINLGCSSKNVSNRGAGAGLLRTPLKIARIFRKLSQVLKVPVTAKMRLGWDAASLNYLLVARVIEENGGSLIAVHGRTRHQGYSGQADWEAIAQICQAVHLPVIANGDVRTAADIERIKALTHCQAVMIGRAAVGNPWIFSRLDRDQVPVAEVRRVLLRHFELSLEFYGPERGMLNFRKHADRYLHPYSPAESLRRTLLSCQEPQLFLALVDDIFSQPVYNSPSIS